MRFTWLAFAALLAGCDSAEDEPATGRQVLPYYIDEASSLPPQPAMRDCGNARECAITAQHDREARTFAREARRARERRDYVRPAFVPFDQRRQHPLAAQRNPGGWISQLEPTKDGACRFTEKPPGSVPVTYMRSASNGNMDLWSEWDGLLHDHAIGFVEAYFGSDEPVVAVRKGLPDLWITPLPVAADETIILYIGPDRFECVRRVQP